MIDTRNLTSGTAATLLVLLVAVTSPAPSLGAPLLTDKNPLSQPGPQRLSAVKDNQPTLDELLRIEPPRPQADDADVRTGIVVEQEVIERLSGTEVSDAFQTALRDMKRASTALADRLEAGLPTQRHQESALQKLDALIAEAKRRCQSCAKGSSGQGEARQQDSGTQSAAGQPASAAGRAASTENPGAFSPGAVGPVAPASGPMAESRAEWGNLPPRLRDQLIQGMRERFSLIYQSLTEAYYRRLAEEPEP